MVLYGGQGHYIVEMVDGASPPLNNDEEEEFLNQNFEYDSKYKFKFFRIKVSNISECDNVMVLSNESNVNLDDRGYNTSKIHVSEFESCLGSNNDLESYLEGERVSSFEEQCNSENDTEAKFVEHRNVTEDVDPFEDLVINPNIEKHGAISPIEWDRVSDDEIRDELHADPPGDEFSKEEEAQKRTLHNIPSTKKSLLNEKKNSLLPSELQNLFKFAKYFLIKSNNFENIEIAKVRSVWATTKGNENRLNKAFFDYQNVLLIFSVRESGKFQGFARINSSSDPRIKVNWIMPSRMNSNLLSNPFKIKWISK